MSEYIYYRYKLVRHGKTIFIAATETEEKKIIQLKEAENQIGKINIPLSTLCTLACKYCSEADYMRSSGAISVQDAKTLIDSYCAYISGELSITRIQLSFDYGGEPMCQLDSLKKIVQYFRKKCNECNKKSLVQMTTNGFWKSSLLPVIIPLIDEFIVSIDGFKEIHERNRITHNGESSFAQIIYNAKAIYMAGKLKQISSVITKETIEKQEAFLAFFCEQFPQAVIKVNPVMITGAAKINGIQKMSMREWKLFMHKSQMYADGKLTLIDATPVKPVDIFYEYGCEHMKGANWFYWLNGRVSCCTDRDNGDYIIGMFDNHKLNIDTKKYKHLLSEIILKTLRNAMIV